jgi:hypothetical protein
MVSGGHSIDSLVSNWPCLKREHKNQETELTRKLVGCGYEARTNKGKQHSISHIVENHVLFARRPVKTV